MKPAKKSNKPKKKRDKLKHLVFDNVGGRYMKVGKVAK